MLHFMATMPAVVSLVSRPATITPLLQASFIAMLGYPERWVKLPTFPMMFCPLHAFALSSAAAAGAYRTTRLFGVGGGEDREARAMYTHTTVACEPQRIVCIAGLT